MPRLGLCISEKVGGPAVWTDTILFIHNTGMREFFWDHVPQGNLVEAQRGASGEPPAPSLGLDPSIADINVRIRYFTVLPQWIASNTAYYLLISLPAQGMCVCRVAIHGIQRVLV